MNIQTLFNLRAVAFEIYDKIISTEKYEVEVFAQEIKNDPYRLSNEIKLLRTIFPNLSFEELNNLILLLKIIQEEKVKKDNIELVATIPEKYQLKIRETLPVVRQMLQEAEKNILVTGFAVSPYFEEIFEILNYKNNEGVLIDFYIDDNIQTLETVSNLCRYIRSNTFNIYKYIGNDTKSQLHAKTIVIDNKQAFVSSANLSYNGFINNVEIGLVISGNLVRTVSQLFYELRNNGHFEKVAQAFFRRDS